MLINNISQNVIISFLCNEGRVLRLKNKNKGTNKKKENKEGLETHMNFFQYATEVELYT